MNNEQIKIQIARHEKQIQILERIKWRLKRATYLRADIDNDLRKKSGPNYFWPDYREKNLVKIQAIMRGYNLLTEAYFGACRMIAPHDFSNLPTDHLFIHLINENEL